MNIPLVIALGAVGVGSRFAVDSWIAKFEFSFPIGTLGINILGCALAGFFFNFGAHKDVTMDPIRMGIIVGFCGGFTTFSGFGIQMMQLISIGRIGSALLYGVSSPLLCVSATALGMLAAKGL